MPLQEERVQVRKEGLLPIRYRHTVFTLPDEHLHILMLYNEPPFTSPAQVVAYIGHYTHCIVISNYRLLDIHEA